MLALGLGQLARSAHGFGLCKAVTEMALHLFEQTAISPEIVISLSSNVFERLEK